MERERAMGREREEEGRIWKKNQEP